MTTVAMTHRGHPAAMTHRGHPARPAHPPVRLTRRGRVVVTLIFLAALLGVSLLVAARSAATGEAGTPEPTRTVVVQRGDTLWDIADEVAPPGDIQRMIHRIETLNALPGPALVEGQELAVPVR